jgi:hypothetical protein
VDEVADHGYTGSVSRRIHLCLRLPHYFGQTVGRNIGASRISNDHPQDKEEDLVSRRLNDKVKFLGAVDQLFLNSTDSRFSASWNVCNHN